MGIEILMDFVLYFDVHNNFFCFCLQQMIDLRHNLAVLSQKMPWEILEEYLRLMFEHQDRESRQFFTQGMFGKNLQVAADGVNNTRLPVRLILSLLYLKHVCDVMDRGLVVWWTENVQWLYFSGMECHQTKFPCDPA